MREWPVWGSSLMLTKSRRDAYTIKVGAHHHADHASCHSHNHPRLSETCFCKYTKCKRCQKAQDRARKVRTNVRSRLACGIESREWYRSTTSVDSDTTDLIHALENLEQDTLGESWRAALAAEFSKSYFHKVGSTGSPWKRNSRTVYFSSKISCDRNTGPMSYIPQVTHTLHSSWFPDPWSFAVKEIYSWSRLTPLESVKVVVLGQVGDEKNRFVFSTTFCPLQDPYHNAGQAHGNYLCSDLFQHQRDVHLGLSFSVLPPTKLPGSLKNIYKQLSLDVPQFKSPANGSD